MERHVARRRVLTRLRKMVEGKCRGLVDWKIMIGVKRLHILWRDIVVNGMVKMVRHGLGPTFKWDQQLRRLDEGS